MEYILEVKNLVKKYDDLAAVDDISFSIPRGICFGLLGPNGAGKTTALETIENIKQPTSGEILFWGKNRESNFHKKVGIQFQETALLQYLTVGETLQIFNDLYRKTTDMDEVIRLCHLSELIDQYNDKISGGQKQRLLLALAIIHEPELVFLDEPSTGMDPQNRRNMWDIISSIKKQGKTVILTTHYMEEASYLCDEVAIMDHGKIISHGSPEVLIQRFSKQITVVLPKSSFDKSQDSLSMKFYELDNSIEIQTEDINSCIQELLEKKVDLSFMTVRSPNLEDVFIHLTGRRLRE